jgi:hypothetical protein
MAEASSSTALADIVCPEYTCMNVHKPMLPNMWLTLCLHTKYSATRVTKTQRHLDTQEMLCAHVTTDIAYIW